ncbi:tetratricopeptide repeat protein [Massilia sp. S19_KUP03_FR1]|uniref:tetratricopeptide repeat protein n=1 Tax=Massilia sp. S19_KUP03_FR1 TaxID=3025503 RepID=UPI002FCD612C
MRFSILVPAMLLALHLSAIAAAQDNASTVATDAASDGLRALSMRNRVAEQQLQAIRTVRSQKTEEQIAQADVDALCDYLRKGFATWHLQTEEERAAITVQVDQFHQRAQPGVSACMGRLVMQRGEAASALLWFFNDGLAADDRLRLDASWARWYAGQHDDALDDAIAYIAAARASGTLAANDVALAVSLHVRAGKALPAGLKKALLGPVNDPWPAPLLAWQRGALSDTALFKSIDGYGPDARALALNDAWFHIGVRRLASRDSAGAAQAWRWYRIDGIRGTLPCVLAGLERPAQLSRDPDLLAGALLLNAGKFAEAAAAWRKAAQRGDVDAQAWLGVMLAEGWGVPRDANAARQLLEPAAKAGAGVALAELAKLAWSDPQADKDKARALLDQAVWLDSPHAMLYLSQLYRSGTLAPPAADSAAELERQAAELDLKDAQGRQAFRYLNGVGVARNDALARYWAQRAIGSGNDDGYAVLARLLMQGSADDQRSAIGMVRGLAEAGNGAAMRTMGYAAMRGIGQPADLALGRTWYARAQQKAGAARMLAFSAALANVENDEPAAFDAMRLAAEDGDADAQLRLAACYRYGRGTPVDAVAFVRWVRAAAAQGNLDAVNNYGDAYETGFGVPRDMPRAMALYRQAALAGAPGALSSLASVHEKGLDTPPNLRLAYTYVLLTQRFIGSSPGAPSVQARARAMAAKLALPEQAQALAVAQAWQLGQALPGEAGLQ